MRNQYFRYNCLRLKTLPEILPKVLIPMDRWGEGGTQVQIERIPARMRAVELRAGERERKAAS